MSEVRVYPLKSMYSIGQGDESHCHYDLSLIPSSQYTRFFNTLPNLIYKKVEKLCFSCNYQYKYENCGRKSERKEKIISESIANKRSNFLPYLIKILRCVLPKTKRLKGLEFASMNIPRGQMSLLLNAIIKCKTLTSIHFRNVPVSDDHFQKFLGYITPYQYSEVAFSGCGLTSRSFPAIKSFIKQKPSTSVTKRILRVFNVENCMFTVKELNTIEDLIKSHMNPVNSDSESDVTIDNGNTTSDSVNGGPPTGRMYSSDDDIALYKGYNASDSINDGPPTGRMDSSEGDDESSSGHSLDDVQSRGRITAPPKPLVSSDGDDHE